MAYSDGIPAVNPNTAGRFISSGIGYPQTSVQYTFVDGSSHFTGGAFSPLAWMLFINAAALVG